MRRLIVLAAALSLGACAHHQTPPPPAPLPIVQPLISFEGVKVEGLQLSGADLLFRARIENGNPFPLSVTRVDYALQLEGRPAAAGSMESPLVVPAPASDAPGLAEITLPVRVRFSAVPGCAKILAAEKEAAYVLAGTVTFETPAGPVRLPLSHAGAVVVPRLPRIHVQRAALTSASPREVTLEVQLTVLNPNAFPIPAGRIGYGLFLSDREVVRAELQLVEPIPAGGSASVGAPVHVSVLKAGRAAARLLIPFSSLDVKLKGEAVFDGVPVPLDLGASLVGNER